MASKLLFIALGGAAGAVLRYAVSGWAYAAFGETFPYGTLAANLIGCFVIGFLWMLSKQALLSPGASAFLLIGLVGAFTTFSTYALESLNLVRDGELWLGLLNLLASNVLGLGLVFLGIVAARAVLAFFSTAS